MSDDEAEAKLQPILEGAGAYLVLCATAKFLAGPVADQIKTLSEHDAQKVVWAAQAVHAVAHLLLK